mgnify:CR=1 FL=1
MTALWVLLILIAVLAALWFLPLRLMLRYDQSGGSVKAEIGLISINVYPRPPAKKKQEKQSDKEKSPEPEREKASSNLGGKLPLFRQLLALGAEALERLLRKLTVTDMRLTLSVATQNQDPALAAIKYGAGWSAVGALIPFLEQHLIIRRRSIQVTMNPAAAEDCILASGTLHIFLGELVHLVLVYGIRGLKLYRLTKKKGGNRNGTSDQ